MISEKRYCPYCGRPISTREHEGRLRLFCATEERFVYENPIPAATGLLVDGDRRVLLVLRNREPGRNLWGLPGGFVETGESPADAARREILEETGLRAEEPELVDMIYQESEFYRTSLLIIGYHFRRYSGSIRPSDDADDARFFPPDRLPDLAFESHRRIITVFFRERAGRG